MEQPAPPGMSPAGRGPVGWVLKDGLKFTEQRKRDTTIQEGPTATCGQRSGTFGNLWQERPKERGQSKNVG